MTSKTDDEMQRSIDLKIRNELFRIERRNRIITLSVISLGIVIITVMVLKGGEKK